MTPLPPPWTRYINKIHGRKGQGLLTHCDQSQLHKTHRWRGLHHQCDRNNHHRWYGLHRHWHLQLQHLSNHNHLQHQHRRHQLHPMPGSTQVKVIGKGEGACNHL